MKNAVVMEVYPMHAKGPNPSLSEIRRNFTGNQNTGRHAP